MDLTEEKDKPTVLRFKVTIPTKDTVLDSLRRMFPMLEVEVETHEEAESQPGEPPALEVYCPHTEDYRRSDGSDCPENCPTKGTLRCPLK